MSRLVIGFKVDLFFPAMMLRSKRTPRTTWKNKTVQSCRLRTWGIHGFVTATASFLRWWFLIPCGSCWPVGWMHCRAASAREEEAHSRSSTRTRRWRLCKFVRLMYMAEVERCRPETWHRKEALASVECTATVLQHRVRTQERSTGLANFKRKRASTVSTHRCEYPNAWFYHQFTALFVEPSGT